MIATTRSAWITPSSMRWVSSEASETEWIGTLRTSMADGMQRSNQMPRSVRDDDRPGAADGGDGLDDVVQAGDDTGQVRPLHEAADGVHLRTHRPACEVALGGVLLHLRERDPAERLSVGRPEAQHSLRYVGRDDQDVGVHEHTEQGGAEVLVDDGLDTGQRPVLPA